MTGSGWTRERPQLVANPPDAAPAAADAGARYRREFERLEPASARTPREASLLCSRRQPAAATSSSPRQSLN
jgi:hypothetical protein